MTLGTPLAAVVGLRREREILAVALRTYRHVVLEGPPGTGKSTLLRSIAADMGQDLVFVEGNAELTPARLIGQYDPAGVLAEGYVPSNFSDGPLLTAMRGSGLLYLEEFNRIPEETLNVLITVLTEGSITVPRLGTVRAAAGFRLIAAMNPFDAIGTARVSQAIADRMCRIVLGYQDAAAERAIVTAVTGKQPSLVALAVQLSRATRHHRDLAMGSSVRGAIDLVLLLDGLLADRGQGLSAADARETARDAMHTALSGRIRVMDGLERTPESILDDILEAEWPRREPPPSEDRALTIAGGRPPPDPGVEDHSSVELDDGQRRSGRGKVVGLPPRPAGPDPFLADSSPAFAGGESGPASRRTGRREMESAHPSFTEISPGVGELDETALARLMSADADEAAALLADLAVATDRELRVAARRLAARILVRMARVGRTPSRGTRRLTPRRGAEGDLDLERTLDRLSAAWPPTAEDLVTRTWSGHRRAVCLAIDRSGSMSGLALAIAGVAAAGVVLAADERLHTSVLTFAREAEVLQHQGQRRAAEDLVLELISLRGHGMTDLAAGLHAARQELLPVSADQRIVVLLSDCLQTVGEPPESVLQGIDQLHVLYPVPSKEAEVAARALAARGGGTARPLRSIRDVGPALTRVLG
ncbi:AAA family ATPase [Blastococcus saxobsidens]|uniref:MoxR-like ATPase n=1 Tax=Blastococcus saxobsidens TaxID=138336 RepID=A0A4Q7Y4Y4_9ACTN|nr:AAA family ATPase [Blastococcus saxobsidens]RZU30965.1 MoxR-like ATPase [Blastococcus saxobsidens]